MMEQPFSTSKVTVEYFDPHGVYKLLAPGLIPRLPLRNLHWQSHAGPLRSIDTLHIELAPEGSVDPKPILSPDPFFPSLQRPETSTGAPEGGDGFQTQIGANAPDSTSKPAAHPNSTPARRHQIPGLRRTPYLKVLLVRCDDSDSYKSSVRQEIRDWVKTHTPSSGAKKTNAENHDAFEWLILHVVVPNTAAAAQPRVTGKSEAAATTAASRWRPGSSTLLEKLRADFNSSSKGATDRIAQIRIGVNDVPYDILPRITNAVPSSYKETAEESEAVWNDLISKIRDLILSSFDMRVSQYEEDIKERDQQRSLPGWNFCTFFILKEGLARGFESVGLVEDALVGYDELGVGLDMAIKEQATGESGATANALLNYTPELKEAVQKALVDIDKENDDDEIVDMQAPESAPREAKTTFDEIPISATKKPYRDLILENKVSVFDFRCYIFARQIALLQRLGNVWSSREELLAKLREQQESIIHGVAPRVPPPKQAENDQEDLSMLAEICRRTLEFIPSVSLVLRSDLQAAFATKKEGEKSKSAPSESALAEIADNLVASFAFSIAQQVLAQTSTKALPIPPSTVAPSDGHEPKAAIPEPKTMMHPARSSSLRTGPPGARSPSPNAFPGPGQNSAVTEHQAAKAKAFLRAGLEDLAARRAELYTLSRNILEESGKKRGWSDGWAHVPVVGESSMVDLVEISLDDNTPSPEDGATLARKIVSIAGINSNLLRAALSNNDDFYRLYETLTDKALRHYTVANHTHSVQACMADLAVLKYHKEDYATAASYFWRTTPFFGESGWSLLELSMLVMYSKCLRELDRKDDFVKVMLKLLSKAAAAESERQKQKRAFRIGEKKEPVKYPDNDAIKGFLNDLLSETKLLSSEIRAPLSNFFSSIEVDKTPEYHDGRDGFSIFLKLSSLLVDEFTVQKASARMVGQTPGAQKEVQLELSEATTIKPGLSRLKLDSTVNVPGGYAIDRIELVASNLCLNLERDASRAQDALDDVLRSSYITIYQRADTLDVRLVSSNRIQLDKNNTVDVELDSGWNELSSAQVKVKAATAGLRLLSSEAKVVDAETLGLDFSKPPEAGLFSFGQIKQGTLVKVRFPFTVENDVSHVSVKIEVSYNTEHGTFIFSKSPSIPISLALGVNVQDIFKHKALMSRFTVSTSSSSPLRLFSSELVGSEVFEAKSGLPPSDPVVIFPRQPASLLYKISRKNVKVTAKSSKTMYLKLEYGIIKDDIAETIKNSITTALKDNTLQPFGRLLFSTVLPHVERELSALDLERAALLGHMPTDFLSSIEWIPQLRGLGLDQNGQDLAISLNGFLMSWLSDHPTLALQTTPAEVGLKSILIPVDVPSMVIVHTADIRLNPEGSSLMPSSSTTIGDLPTLTTNQLAPATLHLRWTRLWDTATPVNEMSDMEFSYEVTAPAETWLIGGRRKGHFVIPAPSAAPEDLSSTAETEADIPLLLIPQREGYLPFPNVDIREVRPFGPMDPVSGNSSGGVTPVDGDTGLCETDLRNLGEAIRVIADREQVTLSLDASGPGGGPLVLGVQARGEAGRVGV